VTYLFLTNEALKKFLDNKGWEADVDAEVTLVTVGGDAMVETLRSQSPMVGFVFDQKGLMGGASIKGVKFTETTPNRSVEECGRPLFPADDARRCPLVRSLPRQTRRHANDRCFQCPVWCAERGQTRCETKSAP
jgi:hypothetical protein